ncbi:6-phosphogluconolactonase [Atopomonas sediminilitoris]|uniref:6-phosphogluconolactonase n=1 Tax=Atopomonas sediminilitoris TaxID=2919919 RepID=UPI001F4E424E|nr:6-phosphogluconolactonase [Atopomonas sediminilitoris]MCJ8169221.1 6-phosphogluconolactonase [Atopomonas sediminilitoris]
MAIFDGFLPAGVQAHALADASVQAQVLAQRVAAALAQAVAEYGDACLLVSGGRSPVAFFHALRAAPLDWAKVRVSLVDERWVPESDPNSNAALVKSHLLQGAAAAAQFEPLYLGVSQRADAQAVTERWQSRRAPDVVVLGMGGDAHTASLFPRAEGLAQGLAEDGPLCLPMQASAAPTARVSCTAALLRRAPVQLLAIAGQEKLQALREALTCDALDKPIKAFLRAPLCIYWCP